MPCSPEAQLSLQSVTLSLTYDTTGTSGGFTVTDHAEGSVTYTRTQLTDDRWLCSGSQNQADLAAELLDPGEFAVTGNACCPCFATIYAKTALPVVIGTRSYTPIGGGGGDTPPDQPITMVATFGITFTACRGNRGTILVGTPGATPQAVEINISSAVTGSAQRNAEILVQLNPVTNFYTGAAEIHWTGPDGVTYVITLTAPVASTRNIAQTITPFFDPPLPTGLTVTAETGGFRIGCSGPFARMPVALPAVFANTLFSLPLITAAESFVGEFQMFVGGAAYLETPGCGGTNATPCGGSFSATNTRTIGPETWTANLTSG